MWRTRSRIQQHCQAGLSYDETQGSAISNLGRSWKNSRLNLLLGFKGKHQSQGRLHKQTLHWTDLIGLQITWMGTKHHIVIADLLGRCLVLFPPGEFQYHLFHPFPVYLFKMVNYQRDPDYIWLCWWHPSLYHHFVGWHPISDGRTRPGSTVGAGHGFASGVAGHGGASGLPGWRLAGLIVVIGLWAYLYVYTIYI